MIPLPLKRVESTHFVWLVAPNNGHEPLPTFSIHVRPKPDFFVGSHQRRHRLCIRMDKYKSLFELDTREA